MVNIYNFLKTFFNNRILNAAPWSFSDHSQNYVSFCPTGMASSQTINTMTACLTKDQNLKMECTFTLVKQTNATCTYEVDKKVVATTGNLTVDPTFKSRGKVEISSNVCVLTLTGLADDKPRLYNCTVQQDKSNATQGLIVEKSKFTFIFTNLECQADAVFFYCPKNHKCSGVMLVYLFLWHPLFSFYSALPSLSLSGSHAVCSVGLSQHNWILH